MYDFETDQFVHEIISEQTNHATTLAVGGENSGRRIPFLGSPGIFGVVGWDRALLQTGSNSFCYLSRAQVLELAVALTQAAQRMEE